MSTTSTRRRSLMALAGVTAGVASAVVPSAFVPSAAQAKPAPAPDLAALRAKIDAIFRAADTTPGATGAGPSAALAATCGGFTNFELGDDYFVPLPTVTQNGGDVNCELARGNAGDGVFKLQDALRKCNLEENIAADKIFGDETLGAVKRAQDYIRNHGFPDFVVDGRYGPETGSHMEWPVFRRGAPGWGCAQAE